MTQYLKKELLEVIKGNAVIAKKRFLPDFEEMQLIGSRLTANHIPFSFKKLRIGKEFYFWIKAEQEWTQAQLDAVTWVVRDLGFFDSDNAADGTGILIAKYEFFNNENDMIEYAKRELEKLEFDSQEKQ